MARDGKIHVTCRHCGSEFALGYLEYPVQYDDDIIVECQACKRNLFFQDYITWLPSKFGYSVTYEDLYAEELQVHIRENLNRANPIHSRLEIILCGTEATFPIGTHKLQTKPDRLSVLLRTSSVGREVLQALPQRLESEGYKLRLRRSPKLKILNQISVLIPIDAMAPAKTVNLVQSVAHDMNAPEPHLFVAAYGLYSAEHDDLPGRLNHYRLTPVGLRFECNSRY